MRKGQTFIYWVGGALVLISSFTITLWLTEPEVPPGLIEPEVPPADKIKLLAASAISDEATLTVAAHAAGLRPSPYVRGSVDVFTRIDSNNAGIMGWAAETAGSRGAPITVMAFADGKSILSVETKGERADVTSALKLSAEATKNVAFAGRLTCTARQKLIVVAATLSGAYAAIRTVSCP